MSHAAYQKYRLTNCDWLPQIPTHWAIKPLKIVVTCNDETLPETTDPDYEFDYVDISSVSLIEGIKHRERMTFEKAPSRARRVVRRGDSIVSTVRTYLKAVATIDEEVRDLIVSTGFAVLRPKSELHQKYLGYFVQTHGFVDTVVARSTGVSYPAILASEIITIPITLPTIPEQQAIASFLDRETARIDTLVDKKRRLVDLLEERRLAIITRAVTKGLDPQAQMKNSGVDWLPSIPTTWHVKHLKHVTVAIIDGTHFTPTYVDDGVPFLRVTDIVAADGQALNMSELKRIPREEHDELIKRCRPGRGDVLYSKNGTIGVARVVDWDFDFSIFVSLCSLTVNREMLIPEFLALSLRSALTQNQISQGAKSNTVTNLHLDKIKEFIIALPNLATQAEIVNFVREREKGLDSIKTKVKNAITILTEYRSALITNAVTGKVDVRGFTHKEVAA